MSKDGSSACPLSSPPAPPSLLLHKPQGQSRRRGKESSLFTSAALLQLFMPRITQAPTGSQKHFTKTPSFHNTQAGLSTVSTGKLLPSQIKPNSTMLGNSLKLALPTTSPIDRDPGINLVYMPFKRHIQTSRKKINSLADRPSNSCHSRHTENRQ